MIRFDKFLLVFSLVSIALGADKDHDTLAIGPASSYTYKQKMCIRDRSLSTGPKPSRCSSIRSVSRPRAVSLRSN